MNNNKTGQTVKANNISIEKELNDAITYHQKGNVNNAKFLYEKILTKNPNHPIALHLLGVIADQFGRKAIAQELIVRATKINPNYDEAHNNLANIYKSIGKLNLAIKHYKLAIKIKPNVADVHYNLATAYDENNQTDKAINEYEKAILLSPNNPIIHFNLANAYRSSGMLSESVNEYRKVIAIKKDYAEAYSQLANIKSFSYIDNDFKKMLSLYEDSGTSNRNKMFLAFGLGKAFEDIGEYEQSIGYIKIGNKIKRSFFEFDIKNWDKYVERQITTFQSDIFKKLICEDKMGEKQIFILGLPRSGTTLIEQIISNHKDVISFGETQAFGQAINSVFELDKYPEILLNIDNKKIEKVATQYFEILRQNPNTFITNKMPDNFKVIGMIKLVFPNAKIIHCVRNGLDNCFSIYKNNFSSKDIVYAYDQTELGNFYNGYRKLMKHWHNVMPNFIFDIKYENIVNEQEKNTRKLLEFCNLEWDENCLRFYDNKRKVNTASAAQVRKPMYSSSIELWKKYKDHINPLIDSLKS